MFFEYCKLHPAFGAEVVGADATRPMDDAAFAEVRQAFDSYSLLLFRGPVIEDDQQLAFSRRFGEVQKSFSANLTGGSYFSRQSNIDVKTGELMPPDHRSMQYQKSNRLFHADSSYRASGSLCSILSAREVPPEGGNTDFVSTRVAWERLPDDLKRKCEGLVVIHSIDYSRSLTVKDVLSEAQKAEAPPVRHHLVQTNPANGKKSLLIGAHAWYVEGWPMDEGKAFLTDLLERASVPDAIYSHHWHAGDVVVWDNRCLLHRATPFDTVRYRRLMQRTTITGGLSEAAA